MGLFGRDDEQDKRLAALETHIRQLTEAVQQNQLDTAKVGIDVIKLQAQVNEKLSAADFDPTIMELNAELAEARQQYEQVSAAAAESWATVQSGAADALGTLRRSLEDAANRLSEAAPK
ncbi:MAG: hypothetical protein JSW10_03440 [Pseudomonadota bacterium]|nr:MAG: hypothetical protein JSW10_03440 [Pseudomonadota bacterium]